MNFKITTDGLQPGRMELEIHEPPLPFRAYSLGIADAENLIGFLRRGIAVASAARASNKPACGCALPMGVMQAEGRNDDQACSLVSPIQALVDAVSPGDGDRRAVRPPSGGDGHAEVHRRS